MCFAWGLIFGGEGMTLTPLNFWYGRWWTWWTTKASRCLQEKTGWWFQIFFIFTPIWGRFPFWRAYFSDGLVQPPTRKRVIFFTPFSVCKRMFFPQPGGHHFIQETDLGGRTSLRRQKKTASAPKKSAKGFLQVPSLKLTWHLKITP